MNKMSKEELYQEGLRYAEGDGVKKDLKKAVSLFEEAIVLGSAEAKRELGLLLIGDRRLQTDASDLEGLKDEINQHERGEQLLEEAAADGDITARKLYIRDHDGYLFAYFLGCFPHLSSFFEERRKCKLARKYKNELLAAGDCDMLYKKAFASIFPDRKIIEQLAEKEYGPAEYTIGCWYRDGNGYDMDIEKAKHYFKLAIQHGGCHYAETALEKMK